MSNKTPKASAAKTASARRVFYGGLIGLVVIFMCLVMASNSYGPRLVIGTKRLRPEYAVTDAVRAQGLSGRLSLAEDQAMVFVFPGSAVQCFWMRDMHFPIDIIWLDDNKTIVHIEPDVSPASYPETICPETPAHYVVETNAGLAQKSQAKIGTKLNF